MKIKPIEEISTAAKQLAESMNIEFIEVFWRPQDESFTFVIDTEDGVDLDTCEKYHNALSDLLDELDPTYGASYTLNVSSPGLDRPLKTERDFTRALGEDVEVKLFAPMKGKKYFEGVLTGYDGNTITVEINGTEEKFQLTKIAKINKAVKFD